MPAPFVRLTLDDFAELLARYQFTRQITQVHMHHTWEPNHRTWRGLASVKAMYDFHTRTNGWSDIAQHVTIDPEGGIWTGRSWNKAPASSSGFNGNGTVGPFMFETVGNFDSGHETLDGAQLEAVRQVIARVQLRFKLPLESLHFHRQLNSPKTCPGSGVDYQRMLGLVKETRDTLAASGGTRELSRAMVADESPFGPSALAITELLRTLGSGVADQQTDVGTAEPPDAEMSGEAARELTSDRAGVRAAPAATRGTDTPLTPDVLNALRAHVVNLSQGEFSRDGRFRSTPEDVNAIFDEHLPRARAEASERGDPLRLVFYAHGGLVGEDDGLRIAHQQAQWWKANKCYPIFFVWETGLGATIKQLLLGARREMPRAATRDLWDYTTDPLVEMAARALGGEKVWGGMKWSAERASSPGGGARYVARRLAQFLEAKAPNGSAPVELHAVGHSAGSIFHAHFLNAVREEREATRIASLSLLAPAIRVDAFRDRLAGLIGPDQMIASSTIFTMARDWEEADDCERIYRKSLLYLVSRALETRKNTPILGLEVALRGDAGLRRLYGLDGARGDGGEVVWSVTDATEGRAASTSRSHGGFDNDAPTMHAVARRILGIDDATPIVPLPAEAVATRALGDEALLPPELAFVRAMDGGVPADVSAAPSASGDGAGGTTTVTVTVADEPRAAAPNGTGRRLALCIGIDQYPDAPLEGCVADANAWASALKKLGFDVAAPLTNAAATRERILSELTRLVERSRAGDVVVFQYAGHGTQLPDVDGDEDGDDKDEALVPVDYASGAYVIDDDLRAVLARIPDGVNFTCFIDCCHSGTITRVLGGSTPEPVNGRTRARFLKATPAMQQAHRDFRAVHPTAKAPKALRTAMREVTFAACQPREVAYETDGHGEFTVRATRMLLGAAGSMTNAAFGKAIVEAFGPSPRQRPLLDCAPESETRLLLQPLGQPSAAPVRIPAGVKTPGSVNRRELVQQLRSLIDALDAE